MSWKYGQMELESWLGGHLSRKQISRLKKRGNIFSKSGIGGVRSKKDMDILLEIVADQAGIQKSKLRRLRWETRNSASAEKYLYLDDTRSGLGSRELYRGPSAIDTKRDRVQRLRESVGQEHYLLKYKTTESGKARSVLESKRIQELAKAGRSWRDIEEEKEPLSPMERSQHMAGLNRATHRRTRLDS